MECPRCKKDTALWMQQISRDGTEVFLCEPCKSAWQKLSSFFGRKYWTANKPVPAGDGDFKELFLLFAKHKDIGAGKVSFREFASTAVWVISKREPSKFSMEGLGISNMTASSEDYAWLAGIFDATGQKDLPALKSRDSIRSRITELTGREALDSSALKRIEPFLKCRRGVIRRELGMRSKEAVLASDEKSKCGSHPEHLDEKETVFAYMAGVFDVDGEIKNGNASVTSDCKFRSAIFEAFFGGSVKKGKSKFTWSGGDVKELAERIAFHVQAESKEELARAYLFHTKGIRKPSVLIRRRKFQGLLGGADRSSAAGSVEHHAPQGVGEDREPNGIASETERPHPSKLNPAGFDSRGERVAILERVAPEIKLSGVTKRSLRQSSKTCFVCKYVLNPKSKVLEPSDGMTVLSKVKHMEKCIRRIIPVDCSVCEKAIMAHEYEADDLSACPSCCKETPEDLSYKD